MNLYERLNIISHLFLSFIKDKLLEVNTIKKAVLLLVIILSLFLITKIDHKVPGDIIKDDDVTITTLVKNENLKEELKKEYKENISEETKNENKKDNINSNTNEKVKNVTETINQDETKTKAKEKTVTVTYQIVNINKADKELLKTLPGIGDAMAERIINYRKTNGDFRTINDIKKVSGIGDKKFEKIKKYIEN